MKISLSILGLMFSIPFSAWGTNETPELYGVWIRVPNRYEISGDYVGIRFDADTLYNIGRGLEVVGKYTQKGDTIIVENYEHTLFTYKVEKLTLDSLIISSSGSTFKYYSRRLEFDSSLVFTSISLALGSSADDRPEFEVRLKKNGKMRFKGFRNCRVQGIKTFSMDESRLKKIDSLFQWSNIRRTNYPELGSVTDQVMTLKVEYGTNQTKTIKGEFDKMPFRLRGLIWYLFKELRVKELI